MKKIFLVFILVFTFFSCVPAKNLVYLQGEPTSKEEIQRINNIPYKFQVDDLIYIDIKSSNDKLVSIFKKVDGGGAAVLNAGQGITGGASYFTDYSVDKNGNIRIPVLGELNVLGYTEVEVRKKIEKELRENYIKDNEDLYVSVKLAGIRYTIIGEVNSPGTNVIFQNRVSIIEAIANSGDITIVGNRKNVEIIRSTGSGIEKYYIDLTDINSFEAKGFYIKSNDIINIKPLKQKVWGTGTTGLQSLTTVISIFTLITSTIILARNL